MNDAKLASDWFKMLTLPLLGMWARGADREDIIMLTFRYDNFSEFLEEQGKFFMWLNFSTVSKKIAAIVKLYTILQIKNSLCQYHHNWNIEEIGDFDKVEEILALGIELHEKELEEKVKQMYPLFYQKVCDSLQQ